MNPSALDILLQIYTHSLKNSMVQPTELKRACSHTDTYTLLNELEDSGYIESSHGSVHLTRKGRSQFTVVFTGGSYDLLHAGHLETLAEAKSFGDILVVVIARNTTVKKNKRTPIIPEEKRLKMVEALELVDVAILGDTHDHLKTVELVRPDVIALGSDQNYEDEVLLGKIRDRGVENVQIRRLKSDYEGLSTTRIIEEIIKRYCKPRELHP